MTKERIVINLAELTEGRLVPGQEVLSAISIAIKKTSRAKKLPPKTSQFPSGLNKFSTVENPSYYQIPGCKIEIRVKQSTKSAESVIDIRRNYTILVIIWKKNFLSRKDTARQQVQAFRHILEVKLQ